MIDLCPTVYAALNPLTPSVFYFYPNSFSDPPIISYSDANNNSDDATDEWAPVAFKVDIWSKTVPQLKALVEQVDTAMRGLGLRRVLSQPLQDPSGLRRQTMRYEGVYNALDNKIYSRS